MSEEKSNFLVKYILHNQFLVAVGVILLGWLIFQLRDILMLLFFSYIIMASLIPFVNLLMKQKVPRVLAVVITFLTTLVILFITIFPLIPFFSSQIQSLLLNFPRYLDEVVKMFGLKIDLSQVNAFLTSQGGNISENAFAITSMLFGIFFSILTVFFISFYLLLDHNHMRQGLVNFFPADLQKKVDKTLIQIEEKLGAWFRGQLVLSLSIGVFTYFAYTLMGIDFALPLAVIAALFEAVPNIGPFLGAIPAVIVALTISPAKALIVILVYIIIQISEANFLVPKVMQRAVGLNPIFIILSIMVGSKLLGLMGALIAIPFVSMLVIVYNSIREEL